MLVYCQLPGLVFILISRTSIISAILTILHFCFVYLRPYRSFLCVLLGTVKVGSALDLSLFACV